MSVPDFRTGPPERAAAVTYLHLNSTQRRLLCLDTLSAMGAVNVSERGEEIWHSCLLPFGNHAHGDRNPACSVNYEKMAVNCFVCGGGSFQWWVATVQGLDSAHEANTWVTKETGQSIETGELSLNKLEEFLAELLKPKQTAYRPPLPHYDETHPRQLALHAPLHDRGAPHPRAHAGDDAGRLERGGEPGDDPSRVARQARRLAGAQPRRARCRAAQVQEHARLPQGLDAVQLALRARPQPGDRGVTDVGATPSGTTAPS